MKRYMDSLFNGIVEFRKNIKIIGNLTSIIFKGTGDKDIAIRRIPGDKVYVSKMKGEKVEDNFCYFDYETGNMVIDVLVSNRATPPTPQKGGLYFNTSTSVWYKCEDGTSWVKANI